MKTDDIRRCHSLNNKRGREALRRFLKENGDDIPEEDIANGTTRNKIRNWVTYCDDAGIVAAARFDPNDWYLCTLKNAAVRKDRRGQGISRHLYRETAARAMKERTKEGYPRCHVLAADVTHDNVPSIRNLQKLGFKHINRFCWAKGKKPSDILHFVRMPSEDDECR